MQLDVAANISALDPAADVARGVLDRAKEKAVADEAIRAYQIRCQGAAQPVALLSGGNQQKVIVAAGPAPQDAC